MKTTNININININNETEEILTGYYEPEDVNWYISSKYVKYIDAETGLPVTIWGRTYISKDFGTLKFTDGEFSNKFVSRQVYAAENNGIAALGRAQVRFRNGNRSDVRIENLVTKYDTNLKDVVSKNRNKKVETEKTQTGLTGDFINQLMKSQYQ